MKLEIDEVEKEKFGGCPFNDSLEVSQYGNVRNSHTGEILERSINKGKYFIVANPKKEGDFELVHRLVALTWLKDEYEKGKRLIVHHIDGNGFNNQKENLIWEKPCDHAHLYHGADIECEECKGKEECYGLLNSLAS